MDIPSANFENYPRIRDMVKSIDSPYELRASYGNVDIFVRLKDGPVYLFTAYTPDGLKEAMEYNGENYVVESGIIIVAALTIDCFLDAIEEVLHLGEFSGLDHYGVLQRPREDKDDPELG